jgi:hypothetical protein
MAIESPQVISEVIEVTEFPEVAQRYHVYGVPKTIINETTSFEGVLPEPEFLNKVVEATVQAAR